ncbi:MAG: hypothetical protein FJW20_21765 [Acidimicrobiia bacterium]|nr:hypothetical protein [Acidimicrobiia bacterium]
MIQYPGPLDDIPQLIQFLRRELPKLSILRKLVITPQQTTVEDVNRDAILFPGLTYSNPALDALLKELRVVYAPQTLHDPSLTPGGVKEFRLSARHAWGEDRVM